MLCECCTRVRVNVHCSKYPLATSTAAQSRHLADVLFLLRDYENALYNYKMCTTDFKTDRSGVHYAAALEMGALCHYIIGRQTTSGSAWKEAEGDMNRAVEQYIKAGELKYAARASCFLALMCRSRRGYGDVSNVFIRLAENVRPLL